MGRPAASALLVGMAIVSTRAVAVFSARTMAAFSTGAAVAAFSVFVLVMAVFVMAVELLFRIAVLAAVSAAVMVTYRCCMWGIK